MRFFAAILILVFSLVLGFYALQVAAFNFWAAGGPPTDQPAAFRIRGWMFAVTAFAILLCGVAVAVRLTCSSKTAVRRARLSEKEDQRDA
jgi:TRAP-type C4-dicarboxylate transport system permease small subunit